MYVTLIREQITCCANICRSRCGVVGGNKEQNSHKRWVATKVVEEKLIEAGVPSVQPELQNNEEPQLSCRVRRSLLGAGD